MSDENVVAVPRPNRSETLGKLALALSKAQGAMLGAAKGNENPFFHSKYADLASVWDACRKPLSDNELAVIQIVDDADKLGRIVVETTILHSSGEWFAGRIAMKPVKDDPQGIGSAITYARRYGLQAIVGVAPEDDDGNAASGNRGNAAPKQDKNSRQSTTIAPGGAPPQEPVRQSSDNITEPQLKRFHAIVNRSGWTEEQAKALLTDNGIHSSKLIPRGQVYEKICSTLETMRFEDYLDSKNNPPRT